MREYTKCIAVINMYVEDGYVETGRFFVGSNSEDASYLFRQLEGTPAVLVSNALLRIDIVLQDEEGLDIVLHSLQCTLQEMGENVKVILREVFKMLNLN